MCGLAFSGKSTLARKIAEHKNALLVSQDNIWHAKEEELRLDPDSDEDWERIQGLSRAEIKRHLLKGDSVVYDDISLRRSDRELLRTLAKDCGAEAILVYLDTPREIQQERKAKNLITKERHDVPDHIVDWGLTQLEAPEASEDSFVFTLDTNVSDWLTALP